MSRFMRFINWLLFGSPIARHPLAVPDNIRNSEMKNTLTSNRMGLFGSFFLQPRFWYFEFSVDISLRKRSRPAC